MKLYGAKPGIATGTKNGSLIGFYPAITSKYGKPKLLPNAGKYETRLQAKSAAQRIIDAQK